MQQIGAMPLRHRTASSKPTVPVIMLSPHGAPQVMGGRALEKRLFYESINLINQSNPRIAKIAVNSNILYFKTKMG